MLCISSDRSTHDSTTNGRSSSVTFSASIFEKSSTSLTMDNSVFDARTTMSLSSAWSGVIPGISDNNSLPAMMALSGVRIS